MLLSNATTPGRLSAVALAALLFTATMPESSLSQVHQLRPLDLDLSVTQNGSIAKTHRAFNRLVITLDEGPFELITLDIGNASIQVCASTSDAPFVSIRAGEMISSLPCFKASVPPTLGNGNMLDGWPLSVSDGTQHSVFLKEYSLGLGDSRITRFEGVNGISDFNDPDEVHLAIVVDRNQNGRLDPDEFSFFDLRIRPASGRGAESTAVLDAAGCRQLLLSEADRIEGALVRMSTRYGTQLGNRFAVDQFSGDSTAVQETKGVFTLLARDQFETMFGQVVATPQRFRNAAAATNPVVCTTGSEIRETAEMAIATYKQLWEATLELASTTIRGWKKVYGKLGQ